MAIRKFPGFAATTSMSGPTLMSRSPMAQVVKSAASGADEAGGSTVLFSVQRIRTNAELEQSMGLDVDASYGSALFGAGVKARLDFAQEGSHSKHFAVQ